MRGELTPAQQGEGLQYLTDGTEIAELVAKNVIADAARNNRAVTPDDYAAGVACLFAAAGKLLEAAYPGDAAAASKALMAAKQSFGRPKRKTTKG